MISYFDLQCTADFYLFRKIDRLFPQKNKKAGENKELSRKTEKTREDKEDKNSNNEQQENGEDKNGHN